MPEKSASGRRLLVLVLAAVLAADFEFHPAPWAAKGCTEDATNDYSDAGRKLNLPHDDRLDVSDDGAVVCVSDSQNPGLGFLAGPTPAGWDRRNSVKLL